MQAGWQRVSELGVHVPVIHTHVRKELQEYSSRARFPVLVGDREAPCALRRGRRGQLSACVGRAGAEGRV